MAEFKEMVVETMCRESLRYHLKQIGKVDKYKASTAEMITIYHENKGRYLSS